MAISVGEQMKLPPNWTVKQDRPCEWWSLYNEHGELIGVSAEEFSQPGINHAWRAEQARKQVNNKGNLLGTTKGAS